MDTQTGGQVTNRHVSLKSEKDEQSIMKNRNLRLKMYNNMLCGYRTQNVCDHKWLKNKKGENLQ